MKHGAEIPNAALITSRPARGAWIETCMGCMCRGKAMSRPARGAWIETITLACYRSRWNVAPRAGRVD